MRDDDDYELFKIYLTEMLRTINEDVASQGGGKYITKSLMDITQKVRYERNRPKSPNSTESDGEKLVNAFLCKLCKKGE